MRPDRASAEQVGVRLDAARAVALVGGDGEERWLEGIRAGEESAFEAMFHAYYRPLRAFVFGYVGSRELADECVQEVLFRFWEQRDRLIVRETLRGYLYAAARNRAIGMLKHRRVTERWEARAAGDVALSAMSQGPASTEDWYAEGELTGALRRAVGRLPMRRREAFTLRWQHRLSNAAIAEVMGVSVKAVEGHLAQALRTLRTELAPLL